MNWDDREDTLDEFSGINKIRHSMECPNCRSNTWSFCCFIPDFKTGRITEGCNECDKRAKKIWDRENVKVSTAITVIVLGGIGVMGFILGHFLR
jgi:hypothetical protein